MLLGLLAALPAQARAPQAPSAAEAEAEMRRLDAALPAQRRAMLPCPDVRALVVHPGRGDIVALGAGGMIVGHRWQDELQMAWPAVVRSDIVAASASADLDRLFVATADGLVRRVDRGPAGPAVARAYPGDETWAEAGLRAIAVSRGGRWLATVGDSGAVRLYDVEAGTESRPVPGLPRPMRAASFADDRLLVVGDGAGALHAIDLADPAAPAVRRVPAHDGAVTAIAIRDGILFSAGGGEVKAWSLPDMAPRGAARPLAGPIDDLSAPAHPLGRRLVLAAQREGRMALLDADTLQTRAEIPSAGGAITCASIDEAGRFVTAAMRGGAVRQWVVGALLGGAAEAVNGHDAPLPFARADYDRVAAQLGFVAAETEEGWLVRGYLLGLSRARRAPAPGALVTDVGYPASGGAAGERGETPFVTWLSIDTLDAADLGPVQRVALRHRDHRGEVRETMLEVATPQAAARARDEVAALLAGDGGGELGLEFAWPDGYVHRVDEDGAAARAGVRVGDFIVRIAHGPPLLMYPGALADLAAAQPVTLGLRRASGEIEDVVVLGAPRGEGMRVARLAELHAAAGYDAAAARLARDAVEHDPRRAQVWLAAARSVPFDERIALLEEGCRRARDIAPLAEAIARLHAFDRAAALAALERWRDPARPDHVVEMLRGICLAEAGPDRHAEAEALLRAAADRGDAEAYLPLVSVIRLSGREEDAGSLLRRHQSFAADHAALPPRPRL
jgi:hypothetical protein